MIRRRINRNHDGYRGRALHISFKLRSVVYFFDTDDSKHLVASDNCSICHRSAPFIRVTVLSEGLNNVAA